MKLLFTGDINFRGLAEPTPKMCADILADVLPYFEKADFRIVNLETPLADKEKHTPIKKSGPNLICNPNNILFLETLNADVCTLANNHTGDFGEGAVVDTLKLLEAHSIQYCGAGANILDFYCVEARLGIELDGNSHFTPEGVEKDFLRKTILDEEHDIEIIHIENNLIWDCSDVVLSFIRESLHQRVHKLKGY